MRILRILLLAGFIAVVVSVGWAADGKNRNYETLGTIERLDARFDKLIAPGAEVEILANGLIWAEGPVWAQADGGYLLFSDIPQPGYEVARKQRHERLPGAERLHR